MKKEKILKFPKNFLWGVSTSAYQIEGGIKNDWSEWEKVNAERLSLRAKTYFKDWQVEKFPEMLEKDNYICDFACDSYNKYKEDIVLVKNLNCRAFRFSIEWARIEPKQGEFNAEAISHYRKMIKKCRKKGIEPFITLWHWTNPIWIRDIGGWENKKTVEYFLKFVEKIVDELGENIKFFITLNEPQTFTGLGYVAGNFPPGIKSLWKANKVFKNLINVHKKAYLLIHEKLGDKVEVGMSNYLVYHSAYDNKFINKLVVKVLDFIRGYRFIDSNKGYRDFISMQYYHHDKIKFGFGGKFIIGKMVNENENVSDMGWGIYPKGIYYILKRLKKYNNPIYITENGIADRDDIKRTDFIRDHLKYVQKAIQEGVDVRGYFYWSLLDNFEWAHGFWPKFGLYSVDRRTFERKARPSASYYAEVCKNNYIKWDSGDF